LFRINLNRAMIVMNSVGWKIRLKGDSVLISSLNRAGGTRRAAYAALEIEISDQKSEIIDQRSEIRVQ
jgi:hypothetical protein